MPIRPAAIAVSLGALAVLPAGALSQSTPADRTRERTAAAVWMDPAWYARAPLQPGQVERATVWFEPQLLGDGNAYMRATTTTYANAVRRTLRATIIDSLKAISEASWSRAGAAVSRLEQQGVVTRCRRYWIINGFTCDLPNGDGELRAHWRKVMDHAALAGLFLVSGAGNFAVESAPNYAPVPVQMRVPEDIPFSVFGVAGVGRDGERPGFSSQGPVVWQTDAYNEGEVQKPDMATINTNILAVDSAGNASYRGPTGWSGNSFAGPHLAGVMALMLELDPDLTPWRARAILVATARDLEPAGVDMQTGAGVVDAYAAVRAVQQSKAARTTR